MVQSDEAKDLGRRHTPGVMQLGSKGYSWERQGSETDDKEEMYLEADWLQVKGCQLLPKALRGIQDQSLPNGPQEDTVQLTLWFQLKRICIFIFVYLGTKENIYIVQVTQFVVICHCHRKLIRTTLALTFLVTFLTYLYRQHPYYQVVWPYNLNEKQTDNTTIDVGLRHLKAKRSWSPIGFCHP